MIYILRCIATALNTKYVHPVRRSSTLEKGLQNETIRLHSAEPGKRPSHEDDTPWAGPERRDKNATARYKARVHMNRKEKTTSLSIYI